jgi:RNA recognition motif-containing protein
MCICYVWIQNFSHLIRYTIVKLFEPFGIISRLDFLFHKDGPLRGRPRGYCFVEYRTPQEAQKAMLKLRGRTLCGRPLVISWSKPVSFCLVMWNA